MKKDDLLREMENSLKQENKKIEKVFDDPNKLKTFLGMDEKVYKHWNNADNLTTILLGMLVGGGIGTIITYLSFSGIGAVLFALGLVSFPLSGPAIAAVLGAVVFFGGKKLKEKMEKALFQKIPKNLNTPLNILGDTLSSYIILKKLHSDLECLKKELMDKVGYNESYINFKIKEVKRHREIYEKQNFKKIFKKFDKKDGLNEEVLLNSFKKISC